jgi:photosystem II stability/assembly factor-like uncharacterized protein
MEDPQNGWAVDDLGRVLKTQNGGFTWMDTIPGIRAVTEYQSFTSVDIDHAWFLESQKTREADCEQKGIDLWTCDLGWTTWRTENGGKTWIPAVTQLADHNRPHPHSIFFSNRSFGWSVMYIRTGAMGHGYYQVFISSNGGVTWLPNNISYSEIEESCITTVGRLWFTNAESGWKGDICLPYSSYSKMYINNGYEAGIDDFISGHFILVNHTTDGGLTWVLQRIAAPNDFLDMMIEKNRQGFEGYVQHSIGRITTYGPHNFGYLAAFGTAWFPVKTSAYQDVDQLFLYYYLSFNSGETYRILPVSRELAEHGSLYFINPMTGWQWETVGDKFQILRTMDGGTTWDWMAYNLFWSGDLQFVDENNGWTLTNINKNKPGASTNIHTDLLWTSDGGRNWRILNPVLLP